MDALIKSASTGAIIRILNNIQRYHKLTTLEEFGIRVAIKEIKKANTTAQPAKEEDKKCPECTHYKVNFPEYKFCPKCGRKCR